MKPTIEAVLTYNLSLKRTVEPIYDYLYTTGQEILDKYNPCKANGADCVAGKGKRCDHCCGGCPYLGDEGCTVKSLWCKLMLCCWARTQSPEGEEELKTLREQAAHWGLLGYRASKEDTFRHISKTIRRMRKEH